MKLRLLQPLSEGGARDQNDRDRQSSGDRGSPRPASDRLALLEEWSLRQWEPLLTWSAQRRLIQPAFHHKRLTTYGTLKTEATVAMLEQKERQKLLAMYEHGLWDSASGGQDDEQEGTEQSETIELGVKITIEPVQDDLQFTLASVDGPVPGAEYTSLEFPELVSTLIHLYWLPHVPDDRTSAVAMAALDTYLTILIQDNEQLKTLYGGRSPFHP